MPQPVEVDGVGELYSGTYYVDEVTHRFSRKGYDQAFKLMRNALGRKAGGGLAGALVGRGYRNRPELTAERFAATSRS